MDLQDKVIVVTGGARGLGFAMAKRLGLHGAKPVIIDLNPQDIDDAIAKLSDDGIDASGHVCNVSQEHEVERCFATIVEQQGALHGLINNAGMLRDALLVKVKDGEVVDRMSLQQWNTVIDVNLTGVFLCGRSAAEWMIKLKCEGVIINISSLSRLGNRGQTNYSATKAGVAAMSVGWAAELSRYGIRSAAIAPGFFYTEMVASMKPEALEAAAAHIPVGRLGDMDEIAKAAQFIFENDYFNGKLIEVDGGLRG